MVETYKIDYNRFALRCYSGNLFYMASSRGVTRAIRAVAIGVWERAVVLESDPFNRSLQELPPAQLVGHIQF
eukprot:8135524-Pyramimonas_sp.AAC.1